MFVKEHNRQHKFKWQISSPLGQGIQISTHSHHHHWFRSTTWDPLRCVHLHSWQPKNQVQLEVRWSQIWWQNYPQIELKEYKMPRQHPRKHKLLHGVRILTNSKGKWKQTKSEKGKIQLTLKSTWKKQIWGWE